MKGTEDVVRISTVPTKIKSMGILRKTHCAIFSVTMACIGCWNKEALDRKALI